MNRAGSGSASLAASTVSADPRFATVDLEQVAAIRVEVDFAEGFDPDGEGPLELGATGVPLRIPSGN